MKKVFFIFLIILIILLLIDQAIKYILIDFVISTQGISKDEIDLHGFYMIKDMPIISIALVFNTGVAFSFLTSLGEWLKYIQIALIFVIIAILYSQKELFRTHYIPFAMMLGGGLSNVLDRFLHGGVVDYIYYHFGFDFPIFNFADVVIDCGIAIFIWQVIFKKKS
ncbi:lipoprotein signal peptidase [Helicobacter saguini]|uniref:Lipoprotein signal peptidase n=1 Tax=Helicobacter saguini TaxID=1548018 RepID=A0A347VRS6_9HELI|nr:signal peptidase II [Helicobacter saguini]MWV62792.1 lipoprotein signal peptidase [Helicobacter saguini]MWV66539.1 lipoprotein signal peptidase [Helicobacter saguini]MWV68888.1 lipoprotein signal peptidase [Helicobacter saguini]MWV71558.1 lipoprotein signal peptidase [Helicobacter saguini]TLD93651.1 lipoprotein signal peptidase [Helicobacter saguini]